MEATWRKDSDNLASTIIPSKQNDTMGEEEGHSISVVSVKAFKQHYPSSQ